MLNMSLALFLLYGFILLSFLENVANNEEFCTAVAVILHFALLSSLSWMLAEAIYVLLGTVKVSRILYRTCVLATNQFMAYLLHRCSTP